MASTVLRAQRLHLYNSQRKTETEIYRVLALNETKRFTRRTKRDATVVLRLPLVRNVNYLFLVVSGPREAVIQPVA